MNIQSSDIILLAHATFGVLGTLSAVWVFVEALNAREDNADRTRRVALVVAACMFAAWILGGYWYIRFYPADKATILSGPWPFAHNIFMETKEHLFFVTAVLALLLPIATREKLYANAAARQLVLAVAALTAITGLALEGAGAVIDHGVKIALLQEQSKGVR